MLEQILYPAIAPYETGFLPVTGGQEIYFELSGNPDGKPVLFLHGGPGGGTSPLQRRFFDPKAYRIILFDQRGCGKSRPFASLENNTTWNLVDDIEALRIHLKVERWQIFGGSWGSTLGLLYAEGHPDRVTELVLRGVFLMRQQDLDWYYRHGANRFFPEAWAEFLSPIPESDRNDLIAAYYRLLTSDDVECVAKAAGAWSRWEADTLALLPDNAAKLQMLDAKFAVPFARIEAHYFFHKGFLKHNDQILEDTHKIQHIPTTIIQGRYDVICPPELAVLLHEALPASQLEIVEGAGHSAFEPEIAKALVAATNRHR